jgi:DNA-binding NtrC family response regulator
VDEPIEEVAEKAAIDEIPRGNETILIVEDDEAVRKLAARVLEKQGYTVLEAHQEFEAMSFCKEREDPIHLILMDVVMPGTSGRKLTGSLKEVRQDFKVLYMSGYTDNAIVHHGVLEKGVNFIQKPFTFEGLARKVREVLDK